MAEAQIVDSIHNHMGGHYSLDVLDAIQLTDGNLLLRTWQDSLTSYNNNQQVIPYLTKFYKISRYGANILDSITFTDFERGWDWMVRLHGDNNGYPNVIIRVSEDHLSLSFFDDDLNFNEEMEVSVLITDERFGNRQIVLDNNDDIILSYVTVINERTWFARYGLDGTLKHSKSYHADTIPNYITDPCVRADGLKQYGGNGLGYNYFGIRQSPNWGGGYCWGFELDSLFNITRKYVLHDSDPAYPYYTYNPRFNGMISQDDGTAYFVRNVRWQPSMWGTVIQKVNENSEVMGAVKFQFCPRPYNQIKGIDMEKDCEGNICYSFFGLDMDSCHYVATVKVDPYLNILWERYALRMQAPTQDFHREARGMTVLDDGAALVFGYNHHYYWNYLIPHHQNNEPWLQGLFLTLMYDKNEGIAETENGVRPYFVYPNPVRDKLFMHFSPDITPTQIELYDLQGRLVKTQRNGLESLNLQGLSAGQYVMKVTLENGKVFSDKVVKE